MTPWHLREARRVLLAGGVVACPTEAVYGLHCDPLSPSAMQHILDLKGRALDKGVILIAARSEQLRAFALELPADGCGWPGPVTWVVPARPQTPHWITGGRATIAVRVTAHPIAAALCEAAGMALVSTSANRSGRPPARSPLMLRRVLHSSPTLILHGQTGGRGRPTEIRDLASGRVLRAG